MDGSGVWIPVSEHSQRFLWVELGGVKRICGALHGSDEGLVTVGSVRYTGRGEHISQSVITDEHFRHDPIRMRLVSDIIKGEVFCQLTLISKHFHRRRTPYKFQR